MARRLETQATFTEGDTLADYQPALKDPDDGDAAINVTGFTVKLFATDKRAKVTVAAITAALTTPASGIVTFDCKTIAAAAGNYDCQIELTDGTPEVQRTEDFAIAVKRKVED